MVSQSLLVISMESSGLAGGICSCLLRSEVTAGLTVMVRALTLGSFTCVPSLPLRTSKSWIWSLHQPSIIATLSGVEYISWGELSTPLEATGRTTEAEARGPGGVMAGSALHRLVGVAPPGPCSLMHAAQHHLKRLCWWEERYILSIKSVISVDIWAHGTAVLLCEGSV